MAKAGVTVCPRSRAGRREDAQLDQLEDDRRAAWFNEYPGGMHIGSSTVNDVTAAKVRTARLLKHTVVVTNGNVSELHFYALPVAKDTDA